VCPLIYAVLVSRASCFSKRRQLKVRGGQSTQKFANTQKHAGFGSPNQLPLEEQSIEQNTRTSTTGGGSSHSQGPKIIFTKKPRKGKAKDKTETKSQLYLTPPKASLRKAAAGRVVVNFQGGLPNAFLLKPQGANKSVRVQGHKTIRVGPTAAQCGGVQKGEPTGGPT